jgi:hypothetical protein
MIDAPAIRAPDTDRRQSTVGSQQKGPAGYEPADPTSTRIGASLT